MAVCVHNRELRLLVQNASVTKQHAGNGHAVCKDQPARFYKLLNNSLCRMHVGLLSITSRQKAARDRRC